MIHLLADTSVLLKWWHSEGETELQEARALRDAHVAGTVQVRIIDLAVYEVGNVLTRALGWAPLDVADQIDDLLVITGTPLSLTTDILRTAAHLAGDHGLTFYDAAWAAAAAGFGVPLISADRQILDAGLAESLTAVVTRLGLTQR